MASFDGGSERVCKIDQECTFYYSLLHYLGQPSGDHGCL
jgi:hypothetical protein